MNRSFVKKLFPQTLAWTGLAVLSTAIAVAQAQKPSAGTPMAQAGQRQSEELAALP